MNYKFGALFRVTPNPCWPDQVLNFILRCVFPVELLWALLPFPTLPFPSLLFPFNMSQDLFLVGAPLAADLEENLGQVVIFGMWLLNLPAGEWEREKGRKAVKGALLSSHYGGQLGSALLGSSPTDWQGGWAVCLPIPHSFWLRDITRAELILSGTSGLL